MSDITSRREFLRSATTATAAMAGGLTVAANQIAAAAATTGNRPNIIFILIDDMRFDAFGLMGHPFLETPNIDKIARQGVLFENSFVTDSLCSPSRATILTGLYAHRHGVLDNVTPMPANTALFPIELQKAGYDTAFCGKWHMGGGSDAPQPGFSRWVSFKGQGVYVNPTFNIDGESKKQDGYITDLLTDYAIGFIKAPRKTPFFLYLSHKAVHAEFSPAERYKGCYADKKYPYPASMANTEENYKGKPEWVRRQRNSWHGVDGMYNKTTDFDTFVRDYAETLRAVDDSVGKLVKTLEARGQLNNTLILFTSDNGFQFGEHGLIDKRTMYEASIRVPMIAYGPGVIAGNRRCREMVTNLDIAPTVLEAAGLSVPASIQGRSFLPLLEDRKTEWRDDFLYEYFWERSFPQTPTVLGVRTDRYKLMAYHGVWDKYELYDLAEDPNEMNNLLGAYVQKNDAGTLDDYIRRNAPEPIKKLFVDLKGRLDRLLQETGARPEPVWFDPQ